MASPTEKLENAIAGLQRALGPVPEPQPDQSRTWRNCHRVIPERAAMGNQGGTCHVGEKNLTSQCSDRAIRGS
jgi:hypothetical protein